MNISNSTEKINFVKKILHCTGSFETTPFDKLRKKTLILANLRKQFGISKIEPFC